MFHTASASRRDEAKRFLFSMVLLFLVFGTFCLGNLNPVSARDLEFFVAVNGNDESAGTRDAPFATLSKAVREAERICKSEKVRRAAIYVRGGRYESEKTIFLNEMDFSSLDEPLLISSWQNESVTFLGGVSLKGWKSEGEGRFSASIPECVQDPKKIQSLCFRDVCMTWARWPNVDPKYPYSSGWAYVDGTPFNMYKDIENEPRNSIKMRETVSWKHPERGFVMIFPRYNWNNNLVPIESLNAETRTLTAAKNFRFGSRPMDRYCVFGMLEELDAPGEWAADFETRRVFFIPPEGMEPESAGTKDTEAEGAGTEGAGTGGSRPGDSVLEELENSVTISHGGAVVGMNACKNITFRGFSIAVGAEAGFRITSSRKIRIEKCRIHDVGFASGAGVDTWQCEDTHVYGCDIYATGYHAVVLNGGDVWSLKPSGNSAENNYIHHTGRFLRAGGAFSVSGCGNRIAHNLGHDFPRGPMSVSGVRNTIEFNRFRHANTESEDTGLIYMNGAGGWINGRGSVIRWNHFSDNVGFGHKKGKYQFFMYSWGIYLDDTSADIKVYGNLVERCTIGCMHLHNARENEIWNNIFVDGGAQQFQMSGWTNDPEGRMMKRHIADMTRNYEKARLCPEWQTMPGMQTPPGETFLPDGTSMRGNRIHRNIFYYPNQPESNYLRARSVNFGFNQFEKNLIWNGGASEPLLTYLAGISKVVRDLTPSLPNSDFKTENSRKLPEKWRFFMNPVPLEEMKAEVSEPGVLKLYAVFNPEKQHVKHAVVRSEQFDLEKGKAYRLSCQMRRTGSDGQATLAVLADGKGLWMPFKRAADEGADGEFHACSSVFQIPAPGDETYDERIQDFCLFLAFYSKTGTLEVKDIRLEEVQLASPWENWKMSGQDQESVLADPLFEDAANGDYRLKPESPALKLGFEPIPFEKIGPYAHPLRASWPIQEADGVKNHPEWLAIPEPSPSVKASIEEAQKQ